MPTAVSSQPFQRGRLTHPHTLDAREHVQENLAEGGLGREKRLVHPDDRLVQGVLGNLMAGLLIIFTKPFRVGEYIEIHGVHGQVHAIELFSVILVHADKSRVVIPNRKIIGEILHNYGSIRQLDLSVGVAYSTDLTKALNAVNAVLARTSTVLKDPAPVVGVASFGDSAVNIAIKPWTKVADFGPGAAAVNQAIAEEFRKQGIEIPFPQREIRVLNADAPSAIRAA